MKVIKKIAMAATAVAVMAGTASAVEFDLGGNVQFRLREETKLSLDSTGSYFEDLTTHEYSNKYLWNLTLGVDVNENLAMNFRLSNPKGSNLETVASNNGTTGSNSMVAIPQAEIVYSNGGFDLSAGLIEVKGNTALNLVRAAEAGSGYYSGINVSSTWGTYTNNSQIGLRLGYDFNENVGLDIVSSIAEYNSVKSGLHSTDLRTIVTAPMSFGDFKIAPTVALRSGIDANDGSQTYNTNGGLDLSYKISSAFSIAAGGGYGLYNTTIASDPTGQGWTQPSGLLLTAKPTIKFGINKVSLGYSFGSASDRASDADYSRTFNFIDLKWAIAVADNFTIMPRYRYWNTGDSDTGSNSAVTSRPEIIFSAKF